ncbi:hypothetical protein ABFS83_07G072900 [Erythranthe nasuta]
MKPNIISRKLIKPCTPTPPNLNKYKLSYMDENLPQMNVGIILFYPPNPNTNIPKEFRVHIHELEKSLSEILPQFYPLAGRFIKNDHLVDCSDQGVEFVEAEFVDDDVDFVDLLSKMETKQLSDLLQPKFHQVDELPTDPLLSVQVTQFKCGALAVSVSVSHRIFDAASVGTFIAAWSSNANNKNLGGKISASFESILLFPGNGPSFGPCLTLPYPPTPVGKRFCFNKDAIVSLRSKLTTYYSRVRVVCAVISKALIGVDRTKQGGKSRPCQIVQAINMRGRTIPPLPKHSCGNLSLSAPVLITTDKVVGIEQLVDILGDGLEKRFADCAEMFSPGGRGWHGVITGPMADMVEKLCSDEVNTIMFSDWSKLGLYEADFGWGQKPLGAGMGPIFQEKMTVLMDNKEGDGMEAWVYLNAEDMAYFVRDEDIKLYTMS